MVTVMTDPDLLIDLAAERFGGRVVEASDEQFAPASRLIADGHPGTGGDRIDAWATRRRRRPGHDWAVIRLGLPGVVRRVVLDTSHITGSHPSEVSVEAIHLPGSPNLIELVRQPERWRDIVARTPVEPDHVASFPVAWSEPATHVRLVAYPDGAIARLRVLGEPIAPAEAIGNPETDVASIAAGAITLDCSDAHYGNPNDMLTADKQRRGPGWLTRRRRDGRHDWAVIRLSGPSELQRVVVDTRGFEGDAPEACSIDAVTAPGSSGDDLRAARWVPLLPKVPLRADHRHEFTELEPVGRITHLRLSIHPDGGISRFAAYGTAARAWHQEERP